MFHFLRRRESDRESAREQAVGRLKGKVQRSRQMLSDADLAASLGFGSDAADEKASLREGLNAESSPEPAGLARGSYTFWSPWSH